MAFLRAYCCEHLKNYRAAALFYGDAIKFNPDDPNIAFAAAVYPLALIESDHLSEAWEYVLHQLAVIPHAASNIIASLICYHQASRTTSDEDRKMLSRKQIRYCSVAWESYQKMPPRHQKHQELRDFMTLGLEAAVFGWMRLGEVEQANDAAKRAGEFNPASPGGPVISAALKAFDHGSESEAPFLQQERRILAKMQPARFAQMALAAAG
jgi:hypothetical protein